MPRGSPWRCSAPSTAAAQAAFGGLAPDGTLLLLGYLPTEPLQLPAMPMVLGRLHVMANPSGSPHDLRDTLAFAAAHNILPDVVPITLDQAPQTLAGMAAGTVRGARRVITF